MIDLAVALKRFRKEFKLTQKQAANAANVSERVYQSYEYGKVSPTANILINISIFFDVSIDYLVGRTDNPNSHKA